MKKELSQKIEIPEGVEANIEGDLLVINGQEGENKRKFNFGLVEIKKDNNTIILECKKSTKREKKTMNTITSHIKNMIGGVQKKFEYNLKVCFSHFPVNVEIKDKEALIKNFLGEKTPRKVVIPEGVSVELDKQQITIKSINKEFAGQAAANFERATIVKGRDRRVFQDGIYLTNKAGREI